MLSNFFKTTLRNLLKNKSYVIINVIGLSLSLACCIVAYLNYKFADDYDDHHLKQSRIYKVQVAKSVQERTIPYGITPLPMGAGLEEQLPELEASTRYATGGLIIKKKQNVLNERIAFVEDRFFDIFTFTFKYGTAESFLDKGSIILSEKTATKLFDMNDPTGELVTLIMDNGTQFSKIVGGVLHDQPMNSSLRFSGLMHFENYLSIYDIDKNDWTSFLAATFILTQDEKKPKNVISYLNEKFIAIQNDARDDWKVAAYTLQPLSTMAVSAEDLRANWLSQAPPKAAVITPLIMALLMLLIACFNFTNTSIAISSKRLKEIGIRKVMGGSKSQLILQFMLENLLLTLLSLILSLTLAIYLVPAYSALWDFIDLELSLLGNVEILYFLFGLLLFTSIIAGIYPAFKVSSYEPVEILKGNLKLGGTSTFSKILLTSQYALTTIALIASLAFSQNAKYQNDLDVGFEKYNIIAVQLDNAAQFDRLNQKISQNPDITQVARTEEHIGQWTYSRTLRNSDQEIEANMMDLGEDYAELMDLKILKGRYFREDLYERDKQNSIIVNEKAVEEFGWEEPIGQMIQVDDSTRLEVIGVMKNFHMDGFWNEIEPFGFRAALDDKTNFAVVKSNAGQSKATYTFLENAWFEMEPDRPFNASYQDEFIKNSEMVNNNITIMFTFLGGLALILSSIGLFTLVSLNVLKRIKEIGIRKVLGASIPNIILKVNQQFIWILLISIVLGAVLAYLAIDALMGSVFAYYKNIGFFSVTIPIAILVLTIFITSVGRTLNSTRKNPIESLRYE